MLIVVKFDTILVSDKGKKTIYVKGTIFIDIGEMGYVVTVNQLEMTLVDIWQC